MRVNDILRKLEIGNSVAEFDEDLEKHFVETEAFRKLISGRVDIIAGDKGTGKTALYKILLRRQGEIVHPVPVNVINGFNPSGNPVFRKLTEGEVLTEGQYIVLWKTYVLALVGNWLLDTIKGRRTRTQKQLEKVLHELDLRMTNGAVHEVFSRVAGKMRQLTPKSVEVQYSVTDTGQPLVVPKVEFANQDGQVTQTPFVRHEEALRLLNTSLSEAQLSVWLVLDRLDEAYQGFPQTETPVLRALFRTYLDLLEFDRIRLKMFVRRDLFRKVTQGGFVNLTHINARKIEIVWEDDDLLALLTKRIQASRDFMDALDLTGKSNIEIFDAIFPRQVDIGTRKPSTWKWMIFRVRDGNAKPPRNLIDLVTMAQTAQVQSEDREQEARQYIAGKPLIEASAIKTAYSKLSYERVTDTLLAEAGAYATEIQRFRDGKAEHDEESLAKIIPGSPARVREVIEMLIDLGFLERVGANYKIPYLYREGLSITQGKAT